AAARGGVERLLRDGAGVGRRGDRPAGYTDGAGNRAQCGVQQRRAGDGPVRRVPDVRAGAGELTPGPTIRSRRRQKGCGSASSTAGAGSRGASSAQRKKLTERALVRQCPPAHSLPPPLDPESPYLHRRGHHVRPDGATLIVLAPEDTS